MKTYRVFITYEFWVDVEAENEEQAELLSENEPIDWEQSEWVSREAIELKV